ncbi:MAG: diguanylate cyclase [bacterium]|nr:diguanylate cyclase [bacterium]
MKIKFKKELGRSDQEILDIIEFLPDAVFVLDKDRKVIAWNRAVEEMTGVPKKKILGKGNYAYSVAFYGKKRPLLADLILGDNPSTKKKYDYVKRQGNTLFAEVFIPSLNKNKGAYLWVKASAIFNKKGEVIGAIESVRDISERKLIEEELKNAHQDLADTIEFLPDATFVLDKDRKVIAWNRAVEEMTGVPKKKILGKGDYAYSVAFYRKKRPLVADLILGDNPSIKKNYDYVISKGTTLFAEVHIPSLYKGKGAYLWVKASAIYDDQGNIKGAIESVRDVTERKLYEDRIRFLSFHDKLTGLYNRVFLEEELKRLDEKKAFPLSIIMADVNNLKVTNDAFGHESGDELLSNAANIIRTSCRSEDIIGRWGGDEFLILLPQSYELNASKIIARVKESCSQVKNMATRPYIAFGTATKENSDQNIKKILKEAEDRMYRNKLSEEKSLYSSFITSLEKALWERHHETQEHTQRMQELVKKMAKALKLSDNTTDELLLMAALHDIGKIGIPDDILLKPDKLTKKEWDIIKKHTEIGFRIAQSNYELSAIADGILAHHERWDGTGYPRGLKGRKIPLIARIISVIDTYDVITNGRPYRKARSKKEAVRELIRNS